MSRRTLVPETGADGARGAAGGEPGPLSGSGDASSEGLIVRRMKKRWGSLLSSGLLLLIRRLIEPPVDTIDDVIAHELRHMAEPHHGAEPELS